MCPKDIVNFRIYIISRRSELIFCERVRRAFLLFHVIYYLLCYHRIIRKFQVKNCIKKSPEYFSWHIQNKRDCSSNIFSVLPLRYRAYKGISYRNKFTPRDCSNCNDNKIFSSEIRVAALACEKFKDARLQVPRVKNARLFANACIFPI